eukprot:TRINITY_DN33802_c0_g1_i1.p1 TRINITY_DN33802_c0_g1~~TRINITY_DN33802_c0_g1_i1.p1  ORF type:complete len:607 (+),score=136.11 TRINITY_DN33802_c0_g1_i1:129-1949(+)
MRIPRFAVLVLLRVVIREVDTAVLSSSKVESCVNDGSPENDCELNVILTISLEHGQTNGTESAELTLREAEGADGEGRVLKKPWRISWSKSRAYWRYPLRYVQDVNNKPIEQVIKTGFLQCDDNPLSVDESLTCGVAYSGGQRVEASEGFCCGCVSNIFSGHPTRSTSGGCSAFDLSQSAHCLSFDPLWYSLFEVDRPQVFYDISVRLARPSDADAPWSAVRYEEVEVTLSHQQPVAQAQNGALRLQLVGDFATATAPHRFESKYLAIPSRPGGHPRVDAEMPLRHALLVDRSLFDLSGSTCNKIGVSFVAFKWQRSKCDSPVQSCLAGQLDDLHREDTRREEQGLPPTKFVRAFCRGAMEMGKSIAGTSGQTRFLACPLEQRHTTLLRLEAKADEATFVTNVAAGEIVKASVDPFQALQGGGWMALLVVSTGSVPAQFSLGVSDCSGGFEAAPAVSLHLQPYESSEASIRLFGSQSGSGSFSCRATLSDVLGKVVDEEVVGFNVSATESSSGAQSEVEREGAATPSGERSTGKSCAETCPSFFDMWCLISHSCWQRFFIILSVAAILVLKCYCCLTRGLPCRILSCCWRGCCAATTGPAVAASRV